MKVLAALLCDDVRKEDTGKIILIGVYTVDIGLNEMPATIAPTLWARLSPLNKKSIRLEVRAKNKEKPERPFFVAGGTINVGDNEKSGDLFISFPNGPVKVEEPFTLVYEIREKGRKWTKALEIPVRANANYGHATASEQPSGQSPPAARG